MNMYKSKKVESTFLSAVFTENNLRIDKEKLTDLSIPELWTGLTMKHETRKLYDSFIEAAVTESYQKAKSRAEQKGQNVDYQLARVTRYLTAEPAQ